MLSASDSMQAASVAAIKKVPSLHNTSQHHADLMVCFAMIV